MVIEIDFNSEEALYMQLRNQIILGIVTEQYREGDVLPSVRALADTVGINMHTVNKAYTVLRQDGFVKVDRRRGAVIAVDIDKLTAVARTRKDLGVIIAQALCRGLSREELHAMVDDIVDEYTV
ncbi:MAG: GntR family transcriptional regulator [Lachnospiraceae bacterium]|nr:GntR family transcriptional regulator [Lachnospiraceae bacterium]